MYLESLLENLIFSTSVLFIFFSIIQLNYKNKLQLNYFLAGNFFTGGLLFLHIWAFMLGLLEFAPFLIHWQLSLILLLGPLFYFYFTAITGAKKYTISGILLHCIPFIVSLTYIIIMNIHDPALVSVYKNNPDVLMNCTVNRTVATINMISNISFSIYMALTLYRVFTVVKGGKLIREMKLVLIFLALFLISALILLVAELLGIRSFATVFLFMLLPVYYMIFSFKYPDFAIKVIHEARNIRYRTAITNNPDISLTESRLLQLMDEEKIYTEPDLTLQSLAQLLMVPPRKMSQIINNRFKKNFNTFINSYRIEEAKRLLSTEPEKSIIAIAFSTGFNSSSSFYSYFLRETGKSPTDYRAGHVKKSP